MTFYTSTLSDDIETDAEIETGEVDALALLQADHDEVTALFIDYRELSRGSVRNVERLDLIEQICEALTVHATLEEEIFYPAARDALGPLDLLEQAEQDHATATVLIEQLQAMDPSDAQYDPTVQKLQAAVEQHVLDEEQELFPQVRDSHLDLLALGERMAERREELMSLAHDLGTDG
jgi:hemerythrin superfamily protein